MSESISRVSERTVRAVTTMARGIASYVVVLCAPLPLGCVWLVWRAGVPDMKRIEQKRVYL